LNVTLKDVTGTAEIFDVGLACIVVCVEMAEVLQLLEALAISALHIEAGKLLWHKEMRDLIRRMSIENSLWGAPNRVVRVALCSNLSSIWVRISLVGKTLRVRNSQLRPESIKSNLANALRR
jgi:hypothetical protein